LISEIESIDYKKTLFIKEYNRGGVLLKLSGASKSGVLFASHMDTLGAMVKNIRDDGRIIFTPVGGYSLLTVLGNYCTIHSDGKNFSGTVLFDNGSVHANGHKFEKEEFDHKNIIIRLDEYVRSKEDVEKLGLSVGDYISWNPNFVKTDNGFIKSRHLDDKLGVAILIALIKDIIINDIKLERDIYFFFSVWEEVGFGANFDFPKEIEEVIIVDNGVLGKEQESDEYSVTICAKDSTGPFHPELKKKLVDIAKSNDIKFKIDTYPHYGSDAATMLRAGNDFKTILVSPGVDTSHSYERTTVTSILHTYNLIRNYIE
jgi:putative aminopeptidase FrvX